MVIKKRFTLLTPIGRFSAWGHGHFDIKARFVEQFPDVNAVDVFSFYADSCPEYLDYQAYKALIDMKLGQSVIHEIDQLVKRLMGDDNE